MTSQAPALSPEHATADAEALYWAFAEREPSVHSPVYYHYPAMMVPEMQGLMMDSILAENPEITRILDPFVGSGTVLAEAMWRGLDFAGQDINPLSILLCRVRQGPYYPETLVERIDALYERIADDTGRDIIVDFPRRSKWFRRDVAIALSRIKRQIEREDALWARRFFWVALAETVRLTCNSRTSTYKLHIRTAKNIKERELDPTRTFHETLDAYCDAFIEHSDELTQHGFLRDGRYTGSTIVRHGDTARGIKPAGKSGLVVTSPPYGDNQTTVPYGQSSYLPLRWIDFSDIGEGLTEEWVETQNAIDRKSLGGSRIDALVANEELAKRSLTFKATLARMATLPRDRRVRVSAFMRDLSPAIDNIVAALEDRAFVVMTIGNRRISKQELPLHAMIRELLEGHGFEHDETWIRDIPNKRMPVRNGLTQTMLREHVLVMHRDGGSP